MKIKKKVSVKEKSEELAEIAKLINSGFAGLNREGKIQDIRQFPDAVPIKSYQNHLRNTK